MKKHLNGRRAAFAATVLVVATAAGASPEAHAQEKPVAHELGIRLPGGVSLSGKLQADDGEGTANAAVSGVVGGVDWAYTDRTISISAGVSSTVTFSKERINMVAPYARFSSSINVNGEVWISPYAHIRTRVPLFDEGHAGAETMLDIGARSSWDVTEEVTVDQRINAHRTWLSGGRKFDIGTYEAGVSWHPSESIRITLPQVSVQHRFSADYDGPDTTSSITTTLDVTF